MIYLDTSMLVSLHIRDVNTLAAIALIRDAGEPLLISSLVELEALNAFNLRLFRNEMSPLERDHAVQDLCDDIQAGVLTLEPIPDSAYTHAKALAQTLPQTIGFHPVHLLHVAAAIELGAGSFFTFDRKQHQTALAAGLAVNLLA